MTRDYFCISITQELSSSLSHIPMACTVKSVALDTKFAPFKWHSIKPPFDRDTLMKPRLERRHQRYMRQFLRQEPHRLHIRRIMSRADRVVRLHCREHFRSDSLHTCHPFRMHCLEADGCEFFGILQNPDFWIAKQSQARLHSS